ncbi:tRNA-uridine aminocarboxypropyltransferase 1 [Denticeps clupeoides]|uniref:tRNA-uridine aminocarboxypropyltransferase 1 n=1 Tax=Denticeps clupeoides TaxID=299321 RepID=A0AAY4ELB6_9TELE|nr:DTW domain-containing protein 1 [Denticeps clupeoides]
MSAESALEGATDVAPNARLGEPFRGLKLASHGVLEAAQTTGRLKCPRCGGSRMFFCYTCLCVLGVDPQGIPLVKLPVKIDIIKHPNETDGKSTAIHAKLLAPEDVTIYTYPCIPELDSRDNKVVLVFPGPNSLTVEEIPQYLSKLENSTEEPSPKRHKVTEKTDDQHCTLERIVFIDSTWNQTTRISSDERLQDLLRVELKTRKTSFWRHQKGSPDTYLSTIEAIYYFMRDYHAHCLLKEYSGEYDNLLFFYSYLHGLINKAKLSAGKL